MRAYQDDPRRIVAEIEAFKELYRQLRMRYAPLIGHGDPLPYDQATMLNESRAINSLHTELQRHCREFQRYHPRLAHRYQDIADFAHYML